MAIPYATTTKFCHACGKVIDARAEICPGCGVRQLVVHHPPASPKRAQRTPPVWVMQVMNTTTILVCVGKLLYSGWSYLTGRKQFEDDIGGALVDFFADFGLWIIALVCLAIGMTKMRKRDQAGEHE